MNQPTSSDPRVWEQRRHPFREEWILFTSHRARRPWMGETKPFEGKPGPSYDPTCYLCPDVRSALRFPIEENFRCELAESLLRGGRERLEDRLRQAGELMLQSHAGYSALGLGAPETDQMINVLKELGPDQGIYGGRSGSGGTVVVLLKKNARSKLAELAKEVKFNDKPASLID